MRPVASMLAIVLALVPVAAPAATSGKGWAPGEKLTMVNCGRCHVIGPRNRWGGVDSTPSFAAIRALPHWEDLMKTFWSRPPHKSFTQVEGLTEPFTDELPARLHPIKLTLKELDEIVDYAKTVKPADLGPRIKTR